MEKARKSLKFMSEIILICLTFSFVRSILEIFLIKVMEKLVRENSNIHLLLPGRDELNGYYKEFIIKNENVNCGLVDNIGEANSDFEDAKTSEEHLSDFIDLTDWDTTMKDGVRKLLSEIREKINL